MNFPSIDIQGSILSTDLLVKIRGEQASFQQGKDFNSDFTNAKLKDDISLAWQEAKGQWTIYKSKLARLKEGENGTTETRNFWISPILTNISYNLTFNRQAEELNGKLFPIGYRDSNLDGFPLYVGGYHESLDKRPENKQLRVSPHAMLQEYLNYSEHLYGIVTNGKQLRLLRDASRITRLSYVEFDLEKMMEEDLYSDFVIFYRLLHASRMPKRIDGGAESIIEKYHQEGLEAGSTIRNKLGDAVKGAILNLANGFINDPNNTELRAAFENGNIELGEYYRHQLRIIYRLLFLFVIEERNLVYSDSKTPETKRYNQIYFNHYSLLRLRKLAKKIPPPEATRHNDLWQGLVSTFSLFEKKEIGVKLGIMSLQGDLFGYNAIQNSYYDLHQCSLNNALLLNITKSLSYFENENQVLIAVNYGGLDVEEFGSVYEGLLELKLTLNKIEGSDQYSCNFDSSNERGKSGSHYTPEELVQPLIKHSLEFLIEDRLKPYQQKKATKETTLSALLQLKICDVACGSGHILLSAARRMALEIARVQTDEEQPNPLAIRKAMKDVVRNCIYGVDKNPLAIELCKIALWLEAYNPGEPLNFLDHHIKCGDAIVGLAHRSELDNGIADEAFKTLAGDDKAIASAFAKRNKEERKRASSANAGQQLTTEQQLENKVQEAMGEYKTFNHLPESTPEEIEDKAKAYQKFVAGKGFTFLKAMADTQVAQFFIPKTDANKDLLMTDGDFRLILSGYKGWQDRKVAKATAVAFEQRIFHWFIEFPEVFNEGGFDCVLGNPPYLGWSGLSESSDSNLIEYISDYFGTSKKCDFATYFVLRISSIINKTAIFSIITTNSISQGDTRRFGLEFLIQKGLKINFALPNISWPGTANVIVTLFGASFKKMNCFLRNKNVSLINSHLTDIFEEDPHSLNTNKGHSYIGHVIYGDGFLIKKEVFEQIKREFPEEISIIYPYITGSDVYSSFDHTSDRSVIYFNEKNENEAKIFKKCFSILEQNVKPFRLTQDSAKYPRMVIEWWKFWANRIELNKKIAHNSFVLVQTRVSKTHGFVFLDKNQIFSDSLVVFDFDNFIYFASLQCTMHELWAWKYSSTMKSDRRYSPTDCFENFPFPQNLVQQNEQQLETIGEAYHEHRKQLMLGMQLGLTKTYNLFHSNAITAQSINDKEKQVASLQKHLEKTANTISFYEAIKGILKLRELHVQMDVAVLDAYGWGFDSAQPDKGIDLRHDFYEVDYLPENDRVRFTIHQDARKEVLKRLLELNHNIHKEEVAAGLFDKKSNSKPKKKTEHNPSQNELF
jgi:methylase of polypeptide subunit release factors